MPPNKSTTDRLREELRALKLERLRLLGVVERLGWERDEAVAKMRELAVQLETRAAS